MRAPDCRTQTDSDPSKPRSPGICDDARRLQEAPRLIRTYRIGSDSPSTEEFAAWAWDLAVATRIVQGDQVPEPPTRSIAEPFWYSNRSTPSLWFRRFRGHFTPRSVFFQNAVRLAVGLACTASRRVAGPFPRFLDASGDIDIDAYVGSDHTLTVLPAFLGTTAGGLVAALVLALAGADSAVYEVAFPFVMFFALAAGPIAGLLAGQALFTLLVALLFAQMAPCPGGSPKSAYSTSSSVVSSAPSSAFWFGHVAQPVKCAAPPRRPWMPQRTTWSQPFSR